MKSILMSIKPKWLKLIEEGKKIVEIRTTKPRKEEPPFCVMLYCTKENPLTEYSGKIVGEFICNEITEITSLRDGDYSYLKNEECNKYDYARYRNMLIKQACMTTDEFINYAGEHKRMFAWRIDSLAMYDDPVSVIGTPPQSWFFYNPYKYFNPKIYKKLLEKARKGAK